MTGEAWYARWFGDEYLQLYPHRDQREARQAVELVLSAVRLARGDRVLDLACGAGRHLHPFRKHDLRAFGLDLSLPLLRRARRRGPVARADMRNIPFAGASFGLVTSFFTSFGYFADPGEDVRVLEEVRRVLRPGGAMAFDFLNAERVRHDLTPREERVVNGVRVIQIRTLHENGEMVEKRIEIHDPSDRFPRVFFERVRLYEADELERMLAETQLETTARFGDYEGNPLSKGAERVILIGRAI